MISPECLLLQRTIYIYTFIYAIYIHIYAIYILEVFAENTPILDAFRTLKELVSALSGWEKKLKLAVR